MIVHAQYDPVSTYAVSSVADCTHESSIHVPVGSEYECLGSFCDCTVGDNWTYFKEYQYLA